MHNVYEIKVFKIFLDNFNYYLSNLGSHLALEYSATRVVSPFIFSR